MAQRGMHLIVGKAGMFSRVACGNRNAILASTYPDFIKDDRRCAKCSSSKHAAFFGKAKGKT